MKTKMRSFAAMLLLVLLMIPTLCVPAMAADVHITTNGDGITISGADFPKMTNTDTPTDLVTGPLDKYKSIAVIITGFLTVTAFLSMIFCITKLSTAGDNEMARKKALMGILTSGIGIALLGSVTLVIGFFWNIFD